MKNTFQDIMPKAINKCSTAQIVPVIYYSKYLNEGQRLTLKRAPLFGANDQLDSITGTLTACNETNIEIMLHYGEEENDRYPFFPGMPFEILTDCFDLGLRFTCSFESLINNRQIILKPYGNLEFFFRRKYPRLQVNLWISCVRSTKSLRTLRRTWKKHAKRIQANKHITELPPISLQHMSLSAGGIQVNLKPPVSIPELCLIYIALEDNGPLICTLCETVWTALPDEQNLQKTGLEFRNIIDTDRQRIERYVKRMARVD